MVIRSPDKDSSLKLLETASAVIDAVGGTTKAHKLAQTKTPQVVVNWRRSGRLPSSTYLIFQIELKARGYRAPSSLWGITEPSAAAAEA